MTFIEQIDAAPEQEKWPVARGFLYGNPTAFFAELRTQRPVLDLPNLVLLTRYADCSLVLRRHQDFGVDLYRPKQGDYFMAQDDTADHWRDKSIMKAILDFEELPDIRRFVGETAAKILADAGNTIDAPKTLTRAVPMAVVRRFFGLDEHDPQDLIDWSYWNQQDAFHNQPFDVVAPEESAYIASQRELSNVKLAIYIGRLVTERSIKIKAGFGGDDPVSRLLRLSFSGAVKFPLAKVVFNCGGLLIGAVETTSHAVNNALAEILSRPDVASEACQAALDEDPSAFDGYVMEALRFRPAFPYFFRTCHRSTVVAGGTPFAYEIKPGTTVLAVTHSAMFDETNFPNPQTFDSARSQGDNFTFGLGIHECLGRAVAGVMVPEVVRQCLRLQGLHATADVTFARGVPESYPLAWRS